MITLWIIAKDSRIFNSFWQVATALFAISSEGSRYPPELLSVGLTPSFKL
jgi:hypothetical protein